jgi:predicted nucleic acid-binding protein
MISSTKNIKILEAVSTNREQSSFAGYFYPDRILQEKRQKQDHSFNLTKTYPELVVSAVTHFEIYTGASQDQLEFWDLFFAQISILPFSAEVSAAAVKIDAALKTKRKQIAIADLFIAATALHSRCNSE